MKRRLIIDGNAVYEIDEECMLKKRIDKKKRQEGEREQEGGKEHMKSSASGQVKP